MIEPYYTCSGGSPTSPDICVLLPFPIILTAQVNPNNTRMSLLLNDTVAVQKNWTLSDWDIEIRGP
jgi:hypothetical protein